MRRLEASVSRRVRHLGENLSLVAFLGLEHAVGGALVADLVTLDPALAGATTLRCASATGAIMRGKVSSGITAVLAGESVLTAEPSKPSAGNTEIVLLLSAGLAAPVLAGEPVTLAERSEYTFRGYARSARPPEIGTEGAIEIGDRFFTGRSAARPRPEAGHVVEGLGLVLGVSKVGPETRPYGITIQVGTR